MIRRVASTLTEILYNPTVETCLDRSKPIKPVIEEILKTWQVDLDRRRPAPAYREGIDGEPIYRGSDFDMFTFLMALAQRRAVINIPAYERLQPAVLQLNQRVVSRANRHGQIYKVISNNDVHSFSARIKDFNVVEMLPNGREEVGAFRHFSIVDQFGRWNDGWGRLEFRATPTERQYFGDHKLVTYEQPIRFRHFVHPHLAMALYGSRYISTKALANRIRDQADYYRILARQLRDAGVRLGEPPEEERQVVTYEPIEKGRTMTVPNIEVRLILPEPKGEYPIYSLGKDGKVTRYNSPPTRNYRAMQGVLRYAERVAKDLTFGIGSAIRAPVRAVELAYFQNGFEIGHRLEAGSEKTPAWGIPPWIRDYRESSRHRIRWNALQLAEEPDIFLMYRVRETTVRTVRETSPVVEEPQAVLV